MRPRCLMNRARRALPALVALALVQAAAALELRSEPQRLVEAITQSVTAELAASAARLEADPDYVTAIVRDLIVPHVDFPALARATLPAHWEELSDGERRCFTTAFRRHLVERYARLLVDYDYSSITTDPLVIGLEDAPVYVTQTVQTPNPEPMNVRYELTLRDGEWKLTDLILVDVSLVENYRNTYTHEVNRDGLGDFLRSFDVCRER
ncbi:MAG: MlaC/ttg2D family ABC transporter substrate-binding protein [Gammaproteobacteria bacterium]